MAYLTKAKEQNAQNEKTDQTKKNKVSVILIEFDCELHYHMQEMPKSSLPLPPKSRCFQRGAVQQCCQRRVQW